MKELNPPSSREVMWKRIMDEMSFEHAVLARHADGVEIAGTVLISEGGAPLRAAYRLACDTAWRTRRFDLEQTFQGERRTLNLMHDGEGSWQINGVEAAQLASCIDVDLGVSPSTNALPINRLRLAIGERAEIRAAWIRPPGLEVVVARQSYERIDERRYRYLSLTSGFTATVEVDDDGLPIEYAGVWRRVAESGPSSPSILADHRRLLAARGFTDALLAAGPASELGEAADVFGWLVGGWMAEVRDYDPHGTVRSGTGEWWFAWTLEGRAIQDVWISPPRKMRNTDDARRDALASDDRYGTTIRRYDLVDKLWRITWINPVSGAANSLSGGREGDRIILIGDQDGRAIRWSFNDITPSSFIWRGESQDESGAWRLGAEFRLRRIS
jgi:hypothetical protein